MLRSSTAARRLLYLAVVATVAGGAYGGYVLLHRGHTPSCRWPLRVQGAANGEQVGLVECYLRALAAQDKTELKAVAVYDPPAVITSADLAYSRDARSGTATVTFTPSPEDSAYLILDIAYANGVKERTGMTNMESMGDSPGWRMAIGTYPDDSTNSSAGAK